MGKSYIAKYHIVWLCVAKMSEEDEIVDIRVRLNGEIKRRFLEIKKAKGLTNNTEVVRLIINEYFEANLTKEASG